MNIPGNSPKRSPGKLSIGREITYSINPPFYRAGCAIFWWRTHFLVPAPAYGPHERANADTKGINPALLGVDRDNMM